jgi:hypothetical protein
MKNLLFIITFLFSISIYGQGKKALRNILESRNQQIKSLESDKKQLDIKNYQLQTEIKTLKSEIKTLTTEKELIANDLKECKDGPAIRLKEAIDFENNKEYQSAFYVYQDIIKSYPTSKEAVTSKKKIEEITKILEKEKKEGEKASNDLNLIKDYDEFRKRTYYKDKRGKGFQSDHYKNVNTPDVKLNLYFSIRDNSSTAEGLRFVIGFSDDDWLFLENVTFLIDGKKYIVTGKFERDNDSDIYEWLDKSVDNNINNLLKAIIKASDIKVRYNGKQYYKDAIINTNQVDAIKNIYEAYFEKGGKL